MLKPDWLGYNSTARGGARAPTMTQIQSRESLAPPAPGRGTHGLWTVAAGASWLAGVPTILIMFAFVILRTLRQLVSLFLSLTRVITVIILLRLTLEYQNFIGKYETANFAIRAAYLLLNKRFRLLSLWLLKPSLFPGKVPGWEERTAGYALFSPRAGIHILQDLPKTCVLN